MAMAMAMAIVNGNGSDYGNVDGRILEYLVMNVEGALVPLVPPPGLPWYSRISLTSALIQP